MIKKLSLSLILAAVFFSASSFISNELGGTIAQAEVAEKEESKSFKSIKVPAMRNRVYSQLARAQNLLTKGKKKKALKYYTK